jgi:predicted AlkP superfamily pyrophosphatase or phosphodiesterase
MARPDYTNSIVNLMSSIGEAFNKRSKYKELKQLPAKELKKSKNVVLMVLDGLGYNYLMSKKSELKKNLRGKMTSVFPPTTASAITTFMTGTAPQQHALTGWFMFLKELGVVAKILPFSPRVGGKDFTNYKIKVEEILDVKCFSEKIKVSSYVVQHKKIADSSYSKANSKKSKRFSYTTFNGYLRQINKIIKSHNQRKYIYAYWPKLDSIGHEYGINSKKAEKHFQEMDKKILSFVKNIKNTNTTLIITGDHGLVDTPKERLIKLEDHPKLQECLTLPLCGDARTAYCYVHPSKTKQFENYVKTKLNKFCKLYKNHELIKNNYYGLFEPNPKLIERIGDYVLIMKKNYVFRDNILKQKRDFHIGNHGGDSEDEMVVPLIVFNV